jgi:uncharacterized membrane protein YdjX (TVP38/TMEM64 family)
MKNKIIFIALVISTFFLYDYYNVGQYLTLDSLKENRGHLLSYYEQNQVGTIFGFFFVYVITMVLAIPAAPIMTLGAGLVFGPWLGTLLVNLGDTLGAVLGFIAARFLIRDWLENKFRDSVAAFNKKTKKNAAKYILFVRMIPVMPFFLVNILSGLTQIPLRTFALATLLGSLPITFIFVGAGSQLATINSIEDIISPGAIGVLFALGLVVIAPGIYSSWKEKKSKSELETTQ